MMQDLIDLFVGWASDQPSIRGSAVLGSHARKQTPADTLSDLDLVVAVQDPVAYLSQMDWLHHFGEPMLTFSKLNGEPDTWHKGRFLERWAGPAVLADLPNTLARYTLPDVQRALLATLHFYERFGRPVAIGFGYNFPDDAYHFATEQVRRVFEI